MKIRTTRLALLILKAVPASFIKFSKVCLVLGVDDMNGGSPPNNHVGSEVAKCSVTWIRPVQWEYGLPKATNLDITASHSRLFAYDAATYSSHSLRIIEASAPRASSFSETGI